MGAHVHTHRHTPQAGLGALGFLPTLQGVSSQGEQSNTPRGAGALPSLWAALFLFILPRHLFGFANSLIHRNSGRVWVGAGTASVPPAAFN